MPEPANPRTRGRALLLVRNTFEHDARVLRAALTLRELGLDVTVLAVRGARAVPAEERREGIRVVRVGPSSTLARRVYRALTSARRSRTTEGASTVVAASGPSPSGAAPAGAAAAARGLVRAFARLLATADFYARGIAAARRLRPDLVQCNDYNTMWIGVAARLLCGSALIYDSHELWPDRNLRSEPRWWLLACEALFVRLADRVVMTSPAHAEALAQRYRVPEPVVVRNIPDRRPVPPATGPGLDGREPVAVYVGGVLRNRGIEETIRALVGTRQVRLRLLGPVAPDYRAELERLATSEGVEHRVEFAPPVPPTEVVEALAGADVGLALFQPSCLSHRLVLPNKLFEYVHAGLPVVGSDLPMISRFVDEHDVGAVVDPADTGAIARTLEEVLAPERNRVLRAAAERARDALDWESEEELLREVYRDAMARQ